MIDIRDAAGVREAQRKRSKCQNVVGKDAHCTLHDAQIFAFVDALSCVTENPTIFVQSWKRSNI